MNHILKHRRYIKNISIIIFSSLKIQHKECFQHDNNILFCFKFFFLFRFVYLFVCISFSSVNVLCVWFVCVCVCVSVISYIQSLCDVFCVFRFFFLPLVSAACMFSFAIYLVEKNLCSKQPKIKAQKHCITTEDCKLCVCLRQSISIGFLCLYNFTKKGRIGLIQ